ncbi:MAG: S9 family peptidase, partial [Phycisphaerae bacterium]|nr:S9 family peptidase [Phycisphaerae bacterium]
ARTEFGLLIAKVDNRGTPGRGKAFEGATYLRLGGPDIDDQAVAASFLAERPYVDASRIGISGHSYGGYATLLAMLRHPEVFRVGVAGAAVSDWRQYDTIYTERYMRTPQENAEGYDAGSAVKLAGNLKGKLLILHGLVDDNVHATNAWALVEELQGKNIPFEMMCFPSADHGIGGPAAEGVKWSFLLKHFGLLDEGAKGPATAPSGAP